MNTCPETLPLEVLPAGQNGDALRTLFELVFGHSMNASQWAWKYAHAGSFHVICRDHSGAIIGHAAVQHTGCTPSGVHLGQVGDVMVHPLHRGFLSGGVFARMLDLLAQEAVQRGFGLCYGFPGDRPARLGLRLGIYLEQLRPKEVHFAPADANGSVWQGWICPVTEISFGEVSQRWVPSEGFTHRMGRTVDELRWRYLESPHQYRFVAIGRGRQGRSLAICRDMGDGSMLLLDWVGALAISPKLLSRVAGALGLSLRVWSHLLASSDQLVLHDTPFVVIRLGKVPLPEELANWLTCCSPGDVDVY